MAGAGQARGRVQRGAGRLEETCALPGGSRALTPR